MQCRHCFNLAKPAKISLWVKWKNAFYQNVTEKTLQPVIIPLGKWTFMFTSPAENWQTSAGLSQPQQETSFSATVVLAITSLHQI